MSNIESFRADVAAQAKAVMECAVCQKSTQIGDLPQPGWVGNKFEPAKSLLLVMQNPGEAPFNYTEQREATMQLSLANFAAAGTPEAYEMLASTFMQDATGANGCPPWPKWSRVVSKIVDSPNEIAWLNVVKVRTKMNSAITDQQSKHGRDAHLLHEIKLLQPIMIVSIGKPAREAVDAISSLARMRFVHESLHGMTPTNESINNVRMRYLQLRKSAQANAG